MNKHLQHKITFALGGFLAFMVAILLVCMIAEGKNILFAEDFEGRIYSAERGYFEAGGKTYYAHKTKSQMYEVGELLTNGAGIPLDAIPARIVYMSEHDQRHYLTEKIRREGNVEAKAFNNWRFVPEEWAVPALERDRKLIFGE